MEAEDGDVGACLGKGVGHGAAEDAAAAGDDGGVAVDVEECVVVWHGMVGSFLLFT